MDTIDSVWLNFEKFTNKPFQSKLIDVKKLSGGLVNHVYRLVFENNSTAVLKYFPKFLAFDNTVEMSQNRYFIEKTALELIGNNEHLQNTLVRVPKLLYSSDKHFTIIMEDAGEDKKTLFDCLKLSNEMSSNDLEKFLTLISKGIHQFSKLISEKLNFKIETHKIFENKPALDIIYGYVSSVFYDQIRKYNICKELEQYSDRIQLWLQMPSDFTNFVFVFGDLWPNSILVDLENNLIWIIDWEMARFETPLRDLYQLGSNLWIMKQNEKLFNSKLIDSLIKRLQLEFFGSEDDDWRLKYFDNEDPQVSFIIWVLTLLKESHWQIENCATVAEKAIKEVTI